MNKIVAEQLKKCSAADLSQYDEGTRTYHIPKACGIKLEAGGCYVISLADALLSKDTSAVLSNNWNKGTVPLCKCMKVEASRLMGGMVCVDGIGYDPDAKRDIDVVWSGWLPTQDIKILERI